MTNLKDVDLKTLQLVTRQWDIRHRLLSSHFWMEASKEILGFNVAIPLARRFFSLIFPNVEANDFDDCIEQTLLVELRQTIKTLLKEKNIQFVEHLLKFIFIHESSLEESDFQHVNIQQHLGRQPSPEIIQIDDDTGDNSNNRIFEDGPLFSSTSPNWEEIQLPNNFFAEQPLETQHSTELIMEEEDNPISEPVEMAPLSASMVSVENLQASPQNDPITDTTATVSDLVPAAAVPASNFGNNGWTTFTIMHAQPILIHDIQNVNSTDLTIFYSINPDVTQDHSYMYQTTFLISPKSTNNNNANNQ